MGAFARVFLARLRALPRGLRVLIEFIANQAGWFACILLAAAGHALWALLAAVPVCLLHLGLSSRPRAVSRLILGATVAGWILDSLVASTGLVVYQPAAVALGPLALAPAWIAGLWAMFATLLECPLAWLARRRLLALGLGAVGGPLAWYGGVRLGAGVVNGVPGYGLIALEWAVATPVLVAWAERVRGGAAKGAVSHG